MQCRSTDAIGLEVIPGFRPYLPYYDYYLVTVKYDLMAVCTPHAFVHSASHHDGASQPILLRLVMMVQASLINGASLFCVLGGILLSNREERGVVSAGQGSSRTRSKERVWGFSFWGNPGVNWGWGGREGGGGGGGGGPGGGGTARRGAARYGAARDSSARDSAARYGAARYGAARYC